MLPVIHSIAVGPITITPHGLFFALGAVTAAGFLVAERNRLNLSVGDILERVFWIFALGLLGARIAYLLAYPDEWQQVSQIITVWEGGLVSFGGLLVGVLLVMLYAVKTTKREAWLAAASRAFLLGWAVGRLGNFFALESAGVVSPTWDFLYGTVPTQLFEALGCLILFFAVKKLKVSDLSYATLGGYLLLRFTVDFWRDETVVAGLRVSQWVCLVLLTVLYVTYRHASRSKKGQGHAA